MSITVASRLGLCVPSGKPWGHWPWEGPCPSSATFTMAISTTSQGSEQLRPGTCDVSQCWRQHTSHPCDLLSSPGSDPPIPCFSPILCLPPCPDLLNFLCCYFGLCPATFPCPAQNLCFLVNNVYSDLFASCVTEI